MKRRLSNVLPILSMLLCAAAVALWVRSQGATAHDFLVWRGNSTRMAESKRGRLWVEWWRAATPVPLPPNYSDLRWRLEGTSNSATGRPIEIGLTPPEKSPANGFGFARGAHDLKSWTGGKQSGTMHAVAVPYWALAAAALLPAAVSLARRRTARARRRSGRCPSCGYDLRATPGRCPECGAATTTPA